MVISWLLTSNFIGQKGLAENIYSAERESITSNTILRKVTFQKWRRNKEFPKQAKTKRVHNHWTALQQILKSLLCAENKRPQPEIIKYRKEKSLTRKREYVIITVSQPHQKLVWRLKDKSRIVTITTRNNEGTCKTKRYKTWSEKQSGGGSKSVLHL